MSHVAVIVLYTEEEDLLVWCIWMGQQGSTVLKHVVLLPF